jgi:DNA repair exonuclease SbcCD ATPase subunit
MLLRPQEDGYKSVLKNQRQLTNNNNKENQQQLDQLQDLQNKYQDLLQQYNQIQKTRKIILEITVI